MKNSKRIVSKIQKNVQKEIVSVSKNRERKWQLVNFCEFDKYATKSYCAIHGVDESLNLGDITKVDETKLEPFNMICGGSPCFVKGTKVITDNGYKNIEDIRVGDMVLTHKNKYMPVVNIGGEHNKNIYSLRVQGFLRTECTDYHPFYCKKNKTSQPEKIRLKDIKKGYFIGSHINIKSNNPYDLSNETCWILGRYVADGHVRKDKRKNRIDSYQYQCILSVGNNKVEQLKDIIKEHNFSCYPHTKSTHRVVFSSMELVNFIIDNNFGRSAETKKIPQLILDLPIDKLQSFLEGYIAGDGCQIENKYQATTISQELAMSLCLVIQKVYKVGCEIYFDERPNKCEIEGRIVNQKNTYMIRFMKESQKQSWFIENDIIWYPVKEIINLNKQKDVYNIEVEEDHTYTANNMITYNCQDFSVAGKQKGSVWTCKDCGHEYNPLTVHWLKRDKCPCCGSNNIEKTRSSLLVEYLRVIRANKPNFGLYENVKNIVGKQFKETTFKLFTDELKEYGYNVYWKVLNAKNYGIPQNRERVYLIFIKKDLDNGKFKFPKPFDNGIRLKDMLEDKVDEKYYISRDKIEKFLKNFNYDFSKNQLGNIENNNSQTNRVYNIDKESPTLNTCSGGNHQPKVLLGIDKTFNKPKIISEANCLTARYDNGFTKRVSEGTAVLENIPISVLNKGEQFDKEIDEAHCLKSRDYKGFDNRGSNAVIQIPQATKKGYIECEQNGVADLSYPTSTTRRGRVQENGNISPTLTASETNICKIESLIRIRKLTPKECFRLMGFSDNDFEKAEKMVSNSQLYKQAGNSIVVDVLYYILVELYKAMPYLFDDLKLSSFFSGIGAFEIALDRLYKNINTGNFIKP